MEFRGQSEQRSRHTIKENPRPLYATGSCPTRASSPRQLPTDHDYAVPTREYQTDQSSHKLLRPLRALPSNNFNNNSKLRRGHRRLDRVTPYQSGFMVSVSDTRSVETKPRNLGR